MERAINHEPLPHRGVSPEENTQRNLHYRITKRNMDCIFAEPLPPALGGKGFMFYGTPL